MGSTPSSPAFASSPIVEVRELDIFELAEKANLAALKRSRLFLHRSHEDSIQEMVIALTKNSYLRPHHHPLPRSESYHVMQGLMTVVHFDDQGNVIRKIRMGTTNGRCMLYRHSSPVWHTVISETPIVIYHETLTGPFEKNDVVKYASWAPDEADTTAGSRYLDSLRQKIS